MNMETDAIHGQAFAETDVSAGSFRTWKTSFQAGTGIMHDHYYLEGRASAIGSDGYVDRAFSKLASYFVQGGYQGNNTSLKAIIFGGREKTYQSWYGIDGQTMDEDRTFNWAGAIFEDDGSIRFYDNQTDNYRQDHYQLHLGHQFSPLFFVSLSAHYTYGSGYYEEYVQEGGFQEYGMEDLYFGLDSMLNEGSYTYYYTDTIRSTDLVRRRWLDNHYYGLTWSVTKKGGRAEVIVGGAYNKYDKARHFGEVIWARFSSQLETGDIYYDNTSFKTDFNTFVKASFSPARNLILYADMQYRHIGYLANGTGSDQARIDIGEQFDFFNPKAGLAYKTGIGTLYGSFAVTHREPIRDDYLDAAPGEKPEPETLRNFELGIRRTGPVYGYTANLYLMSYVNQLVLTGAINEDGAYVRKNTGKSYRTGFELSGNYRLSSFIRIGGNVSFSKAATDYRRLDSEGHIETFDHVTLSFSPSVIGGLHLDFFPVKNLRLTGTAKYVGNQYLDNTGNPDLMLKGYTVSDLDLSYLLSFSGILTVEFNLQVNNIFNTKYASNGYAWGDVPYYYPQAGRHFMAGISLKI
jgi:iron complex outermembrane receptor protein